MYEDIKNGMSLYEDGLCMLQSSVGEKKTPQNIPHFHLQLKNEGMQQT